MQWLQLPAGDCGACSQADRGPAGGVAGQRGKARSTLRGSDRAYSHRAVRCWRQAVKFDLLDGKVTPHLFPLSTPTNHAYYAVENDTPSSTLYDGIIRTLYRHTRAGGHHSVMKLQPF